MIMMMMVVVVVMMMMMPVLYVHIARVYQFISQHEVMA